MKKQTIYSDSIKIVDNMRRILFSDSYSSYLKKEDLTYEEMKIFLKLNKNNFNGKKFKNRLDVLYEDIYLYNKMLKESIEDEDMIRAFMIKKIIKNKKSKYYNLLNKKFSKKEKTT